MNPYRYVYQLWTCEQEGFIPAMTEFRHTKVEEYNWNYLDQHVCGYSDFEELREVSQGGERNSSSKRDS